MLTEAEIQRSFRKMFVNPAEVNSDTFERAEALLEELRPESPLRFRLMGELEELRTLAEA